jgi:TetR/AcrR family transcriptional regulator, macrolide resistance operon repressor
MPRPKLLSDDEVLDATRKVVQRRGPAQFTLADVAVEVGLARSTLIQRFESRDGLYRRFMERGTNRLQSDLDALPGGTKPQELWRFLHALVSVLKSERINEYLLMVVEEMSDPFLANLARRRVCLVREAVAQRLPETMVDRTEMARHLQAVMQGASMQWAVEREGELSHFVAVRLRTALALLFPGEVFDHPDTAGAAESKEHSNDARNDQPI